MNTTANPSALADEIIAASRREQAWCRDLQFPLPRWFHGAYLDGLDSDARRARWKALERRVNQRRDWVLATLAVDAAIALPLLLIGGWHAVMLGCGLMGATVLVGRGFALRREFRQDVRAFAARRADES